MFDSLHGELKLEKLLQDTRMPVLYFTAVLEMKL